MERYDWARARRGYWAGKVRIGEPERRRLLDVDLIDAFPDSKSVNDALRRIVKAAKPRSVEARMSGGVARPRCWAGWLRDELILMKDLRAHS